MVSVVLQLKFCKTWCQSVFLISGVNFNRAVYFAKVLYVFLYNKIFYKKMSLQT